jgi:cytochrome c-type biogenesis protein CcmH/NrfG
LGDPQRAIEFEQVATERTPKNAVRWKTLGDLYAKVGQAQLAEQAYQRANALSQ